MFTMSATTDMNEWTRSGWVFSPGHHVGIVDSPPPQAAEEFLEEVLQGVDPEEFSELLEDTLLARDAEGEYGTRGVESCISYTEYRNKRLGSNS